MNKDFIDYRLPDLDKAIEKTRENFDLFIAALDGTTDIVDRTEEQWEYIFTSLGKQRDQQKNKVTELQGF